MKKVYDSVVKPYVTWGGAAGLTGILIVFLFYFYKLGNLVSGMSALEISAISSSTTKAEILANPLYLPHKLVVYLLTKLEVYSPEALRAVSTIFVILVIIAFYQLVKKWHSTRIAYLATIMFASSSWLLATGRHASPTALLLIWFVLLVGLFWFKHYARRKYFSYLLVIIFAAALYVPTAPYIFTIFLVLYSKKILAFFRKIGSLHTVGVLLLAILLSLPLIYSFVKDPTLIRDWLLIPETISPRTLLNNFIALPKALIYAAPHNPEFWLSRLPLLDLFSGTLFLLGLYAYRYHLKLKRTPLVWLCTIVATLIVGFYGLGAAIILLPFIYIIIANGLSFLLGEWLKVFPRNPVARYLGTGLIIIAVAASSFYQVSRYFVAWPKAPATRETYSIRQ
ncbi:MAG: glycosyltransferase family 39 protein [bacterium]|nr:glycosyltransferase family 39 protein [bacterium]